MNTQTDNDLDCEFEYEVIFELPANGMPIYVPMSGGGLGRDGVMVKFNPVRGNRWIGIFAFGDMLPKGECKVFPGPGNNRLTVIAKGDAYIVSPNNPEKYKRVKSCPVIGAIPIPHRGLVVFYDYTEVVAYDEKGLVWETDRVSWDGIEINEVTESELIGRSWDAPSERKVDLRVNLANGHHQGGSAPPAYPHS
jgi:hypothetical protein